MNARREELARRLDAVRARIEAACARSGRDPGGLTLVVVTKTYPAADVRLLAALGVRDVAENRDQEAAAKADETRDLDLVRHFVGRLQSNKARSVVRYADLVHSVDRESLVAPLDRAAEGRDRRLDCLLQVSLDGDPARGGALPGAVPALAGLVAGAAHLRLRGVMAVAPLGEDPDRAFARLREVADRLRADHPAAALISAGMSGDLESAVAHGATHLRVGSAILGERARTG